MFSLSLTRSPEPDEDEPDGNISIISNHDSTFELTSVVTDEEEVQSLKTSNTIIETFEHYPHLKSEILVYCQNFNRMKSASKMHEIHNKVLSCPYPIILGTETSWDKTVKSEEVFGNNYNVFRDDRDCLTSEKKSGVEY